MVIPYGFMDYLTLSLEKKKKRNHVINNENKKENVERTREISINHADT